MLGSNERDGSHDGFIPGDYANVRFGKEKNK